MNKNDSIYQTIAEASNSLKIKLIKQLGNDDKNQIIELSKELGPIFGNDAILTISNIDKYFNKNTYPFIAEFNNHIIGFIIGVPLEIFSEESWSHYDVNLGKNNTIYTYIYLIKKNYRKQGGYSKTLKMIYLNWAKKRGYKFITGHVIKGLSEKFSPKTEVIKIFPSWYGQNEPYEYYRRPL